MGYCKLGHFGPAACTTRRGCGYPEGDSRQPAVHGGEAQRAAPRRCERGLAGGARPAINLAGDMYVVHGLHMHMHMHMHMQMKHTSRGTCMSIDFRFCCDGAPAVAGVCHHLCGDGGRGWPLKRH